MNKPIFVAAVLTGTTLLAAGLAVFLGSVQEAQANPCSTAVEGGAEDVDTDFNCDFEGIGSLTIVESGGGLTEAPIILPTP
jgi:hypothetical protein